MAIITTAAQLNAITGAAEWYSSTDSPVYTAPTTEMNTPAIIAR